MRKASANAFPRTHLRPDFLVAPRRTSIRCAIYTRQSVSSADGLSSGQVQFEACDAFVRSQRSNGWLLIDERFEDDGYSGAISDRPALSRVLNLIRKREVDRLVLYRLDRLSRSLLGSASILHELRECGVGLVIVTAPELGNSPQDSFMLNILAAFVAFEREMIASRIAESRVRLKARGRRIAGAVPFGYDADQVIATLRNPVYLGLFRDKGDFRIGDHEAIVTHELFAAVSAQLAARRKGRSGARYQIDWPLKGRITCAVCGTPMSAHTMRYRKFLYRYYRCRSTAGGQRPCGHQVPAREIGGAVRQNLEVLWDVRLDENQIRDYVESVV
jgi:DNA invertase Pin-like site-specific DNA recombinase